MSCAIVTSSRCFLNISFVTSLSVACLGLETYSVAFAMSQSTRSSEESVKDEKNFVADWSANGSACKGGRGQDSQNVRLFIEEPTVILPHTLKLTFRLASMQLESPAPFPGKTLPLQEIVRENQNRENQYRENQNHENKVTNVSETLSFAKECSIRVALYPPKGKKIRNVVGVMTAVVSKAPNIKAWASADLMIGNATVSEQRFDYTAEEGFSRRHQEFLLVQGRTSKESMPVSRCGQPRLLSLDTIFAAERKSFQDKVEMALAEGGLVKVSVETESCE